jgi:dTMP kinase
MVHASAGTGGRFIVFEGIDGSGLSTQAFRLQGYLRDVLGLPAHLTKEPTDGPAGANVRLKLRGRLTMDEATLALFFAADRLDHLATDILPRLAAGIPVISDRYCLSSFAYQSLSLELDWLRAINSRCRPPDLTIFLDVPVNICMARLRSQRWRLELYETQDKLEQVRRNYLRLVSVLQREGERVVVIPGIAAGRERPIADVAADVQAAVGPLFAHAG